MVLAKRLGQNPRALAQAIVDALDLTGLAGTPEIAGPGFINFTLSAEALGEKVTAMIGDRQLGVPTVAQAQRVVIDFSAPNVAKRMHVGHIRSTIIGDCLARVARFIGHEVITDNHIGDWGTQFGMVIYGWKNYLDEEALKLDPINELLRLYQQVNAEEKAQPELRDVCKNELVKLQQGDEENRAIWQKCVDFSLEALRKIYRQLDIEFDHYLGESFYNGRLASLVKDLQALGLARESEGAMCVFFDDVPELADKPALVQKSDGGFLYATTDLATLEYRVKEWHADAIWYVVGAPQALHMQQVFAAARRWGFREVKLEHVAFGSILGSDRKLMRTRSGESVGLIEVLDEAVERAHAIVQEKNPELTAEEKNDIAQAVGLGAVKYAELSQHRLTDYVFAWEKLLSFQGNTAPYLQNAYVRTRAIFRKIEEEKIDFTTPVTLSEAAEQRLALLLGQFGEIVPQVVEDFRPNLLAAYLYELATGFHGFYEACPVLKADRAQARQTRLVLCELTSRVLRQGLSLLGIRVTEKM
jgi:arginyl-tRNA synthetase